MAALVNRMWSAFSPPNSPAKSPDALKFGILGAAEVAGMALIIPAKTHPEVVIQAVAARNREKAEAFAKANGIPEVKASYQEILDDPNIDCIFIPLPNNLHFEWAIRSIRAGKHVLLEKPSTSNSSEAEVLFNLPELQGPSAPVLLEGFHMRFYPAFVFFQTLVNPAEVAKISTFSMIPWWMTNKESSSQFNYSLSGGTIMAMGTYNFAAMRLIMGEEPEECLSCDTQAFTEGKNNKCDWEFKANFRFSGGRMGEAHSTLRGPTVWTPSFIKVTTKEKTVSDKALPKYQEKVQWQELTLHGMVHGVAWHRIDVKDITQVREVSSGKVISNQERTKNHKAYTFGEAHKSLAHRPSEPHWMSFRYQMEQFVNKVKGRETPTWFSAEDSLAQMRMIDMAYKKSGLGVRPSSDYKY